MAQKQISGDKADQACSRQNANIFYKQIMDETVRGENTVHLERLLVEQSKEFLKSDQKDVTKSKLYQTLEKYIDTQDIQLQIYQEDTFVYLIRR